MVDIHTGPPLRNREAAMKPQQDLWKDFEHTGSVADYLRFKQAVCREEEPNANDNAGAGAPGSKIS